MPYLSDIVFGDDFAPVLSPPMRPRIEICRFDLNNGDFAVGQDCKIIHIRQHPKIQRMLIHFFDLIDVQTRFFGKDSRDQIFQ